jgi:hypothetical protein
MVPLSEPPGGLRYALKLSIQIPRAALESVVRAAPEKQHLERLAGAIAFALDFAARTSRYWPRRASAGPARHRKGLQVVHARYRRAPITITLRRADLKGLDRWLELGRARELRYSIRTVLLSHHLVDWCLNGKPRGRTWAAAYLLPVARSAWFYAERLVETARDDRALRQQIEGVLRGSASTRELVPGDVTRSTPEEQIRALVDRTLRPAWRIWGVAAPAGRAYALLEPAERRLRAEHSDPETECTWRARLLGPEGQAARDFDLL